MTRAAPLVAALAFSVAGCAGSPPLADGLSPAAPRSIELGATPYFPQQDFQCGPAALATLLVASGVEVTSDALTPQVYIPGRRGSLQAELVGAARRHGRLPYVLASTADEMIAELVAGRPVLVLQNLGAMRLPRWHYAVLIGYDAGKNVAILRSGRKERLEMRWQRFAGTWHRGGRWAITTLEPGLIPPHADPDRYVEAVAGLEAAGKLEAAAASYDAALARWPQSSHAWLGRGNVAYGQGDLPAAASAYARAIELAPGDAAPRNNLAQVLADANCIAEARRQSARAEELAAGTPLAATVGELRAKLATASAEAACSLTGRLWPD
ncbi:MAG: PA2778 family cysteine peptidase [Steroidobacteraceae bacterium]